jgi:alkanesulfonate monooxygenase SsuD/methylene tetrahydromethanopterin reductase-like flavin-dependent oxidoreductase (luciferase family)
MIATGQHYLADYVQLQQIPLLGRLAAEAGDMRIATGINLLSLHHPVEIAEQLTTLEAMGPNVIAGVGAGYPGAEFESFGIPKFERIPRLIEGIELMKKLWTDTSVTYDGTHYSVADASITPRPTERFPSGSRPMHQQQLSEQLATVMRGL